MIPFQLNGNQINYEGDENGFLLDFLRLEKHLTAVKDGCSGQAACGACTVEINGKAKLACVTKMKTLENAEIFTPEGFPPHVLDIIAKTFVNQGAVQCGFCTPGFITRTKVLLQDNPHPTIQEIHQAIKPHLCRCTGYKKIEEAIGVAGDLLEKGTPIEITATSGKVGEPCKRPLEKGNLWMICFSTECFSLP